MNAQSDRQHVYTHCMKSGPHDDITGKHMDECEEYPIGCPRKCKGSEQLKRKNLKNHAEVCPLEPVQCPFSEVGCTKQRLVRRDLSNHVKSNVDKHMMKMMAAHTTLVAEHKKLQSDHSKLQDDYKGLKLELADMQIKHSHMEANISGMTSSISQELNFILSDKYYNNMPVQCIKTALKPKVEKEGDKIVFRVLQFTDEWTSSPFYVLDGYKMRLVLTRPSEVDQRRDFQRRDDLERGSDRTLQLTKVAVQLMKGENDDRLKWPINSELSLVINDGSGKSSSFAGFGAAGHLVTTKYLLGWSHRLARELRLILNDHQLDRVVEEMPRELKSESVESKGPWNLAEISLSAKD